jgi:bacteriorhodopsin
MQCRHGFYNNHPANNIFFLKNNFMAEIRVEAKKSSSSSWIWIVIAVLIVAALIYFLTRDNKADNTVEQTSPTAFVQFPPNTLRSVYVV